MATSTNYGWAEPDNTSLVKDGAQAMRTLGDAIDTSVWNVGFGQAGKNKIINGDFRINQRAFTSTTTSSTFGFDRFRLARGAGGTVTYSAQTFTAGAAPVAGYEAINFARLVTTGQSAVGDFSAIANPIEDVRTFAGQTITVSVWAKGANAGDKFNFAIEQAFGTSGSSAVITKGAVKTLTTSWVRYSTTFTVPSVSGKTITSDSKIIVWLFTSAGSSLSSYSDLGNLNQTVDFWGLQAEYGSLATPFQTATGTIQGELAACQRYFQALSAFACAGYAVGASESIMNTLPFLTAMRATPTVTITSNGSTSRLSSAQIQNTSSTSAILQVVSSSAGFCGIYGGTTATASIEL
jgi:hypothetical protein